MIIVFTQVFITILLNITITYAMTYSFKVLLYVICIVFSTEKQNLFENSYVFKLAYTT